MTHTIATTILEQLGGRRFQAMTGASNFVGLDRGLMFALPGLPNGINKIRVTLTAADLYLVEAFRIRGAKVVPLASLDGIYAENLQEVFTSMTGLYTRL